MKLNIIAGKEGRDTDRGRGRLNLQIESNLNQFNIIKADNLFY